MLTRARFIIGFASALAAQVASIPHAQACSASNCAPEIFLPFEGALPANAAGIYWYPGHDDAGETQLADLSLSCALSDGVSHRIELEAMAIGAFGYQLLVPKTPLVAGEACELVGPRTDCGYAGDDKQGRASFVVSPHVPLPGMLGELIASEPSIQDVQASTSVGSCYVTRAACAIDLSIELSEEAAPWRDALVFTTYVDGVEWRHQSSLIDGNVTGGSAIGRAKDQLYAWASGANEGDELGLTPGMHSVELRATLPGTDIEILTEAMPVALYCEPPREGDAGPPGGPDGGTVVDEPAPQQLPFEGDDVREEDDGGCSASGRASSTTFGGLALALSALVVRRRRPA